LVQIASKATLLHRSRFDIIATILSAANEGGAKKTHIMYKCNLSFKQLHSYLQFLIEMGLLRHVIENIEADENSVLFETTKKGEAFIKAYRNLKALLTSDLKEHIS
jgi:predicted transcriptional regulator